MYSGTQNWPINRQYSRYKLEAPIGVQQGGGETLRGWCRNIGEGGACATFAARLAIGDQVRLDIRLPGNRDAMEIPAIVRYVNSMRYGLEFTTLTFGQRARIRQFGRKLQCVAYLLSSNPTDVRDLQHLLQQIGISQVSFGSPKNLPVQQPCLVVMDCEWPDFLEVMQFLRTEAGGEPLVIVALLGKESDARKAQENGADLVARKPVTSAWTKRVLATASNLLKRDVDLPSRPAQGVNLPADQRQNA